MLRLLTILFINILVINSWAAESPGFYDNPKKGMEGFYGYEPLKKDEEKKEDEKKEQPKAQTKQHRLPLLKDYTTQELYDMHPDDFQPLMSDFHKKSVMTRKPDDVKEYITVLDIMRRRSLAYMNVYMYVLQQHPELNVERDYPISDVGRTRMTGQQIGEVESKLKNLREDYALLYFYSPTCEYCVAQDQILESFVRMYGWTIKKYDKNIEKEKANSFRVEMTPTLILIHKHSPGFLRISDGVISLTPLEHSLFRGIRFLSGEITAEEYTMYEFDKGGAFDVKAPLGRERR